uniref:Secreted protein n=1 Tax=Macrostomum lignano TaxID=282301 RepID=A0A1I8IY97_9PLAT
MRHRNCWRLFLLQLLVLLSQQHLQAASRPTADSKSPVSGAATAARLSCWGGVACGADSD